MHFTNEAKGAHPAIVRSFETLPGHLSEWIFIQIINKFGSITDRVRESQIRKKLPRTVLVCSPAACIMFYSILKLKKLLSQFHSLIKMLLLAFKELRLHLQEIIPMSCNNL